MDIVKELDALEDQFSIDDIDEQKEELIQKIQELHLVAMEDPDTLNRFTVHSSGRFGGIFIPYLFWIKLADFIEDQQERHFLQDLIKAFANSDFAEEEQKMMKPLVITYIAKEKSFEIDKLQTLVIEKSHPQVREYFQKLIAFVDKNQRSTEMYCEKFMLLRELAPNFKLMSLPITQLKEQLG